ncbi:MAG TPA: hypothetical protein VGM50_23285, partial [Gemmatimonadaceae bacterium]
LTEGYLSQPVIMSHAAWSLLRAIATLNFEGATLKRGELNTGGYGEGYVDRRHPHALVHELLAGVETEKSTWGASFFAGRGFAPFGSDDPMVRPFEKYPVNHHLSQILERVVAVGAVRAGPVIGEFGTFNGDEPSGPYAAPNFSRFGDSWASRITVLPLANSEVSASYASVKSPEVRVGQGLDQRKGSVVARYDVQTESMWNYALAEWSHTSERDNGEPTTSLTSWLAEGAVCRSGVILAARYELTDRPEEEQLADPFRTPRPSTDASNLGVSRWSVVSGALSAPRYTAGWVSGRPFVEVEYLVPRAGDPPGLFDPELRYGATSMWMFSFGVRLRAGSMHDRMGRYGAALPPSSSHMNMAGMGGTSTMSDMPGMSHSSSSTKARANRCEL